MAHRAIANVCMHHQDQECRDAQGVMLEHDRYHLVLRHDRVDVHVGVGRACHGHLRAGKDDHGKEAECNSLYLTKQELSFGKDHCDELMWQLTKPSGDVYKWEYRKEV